MGQLVELRAQAVGLAGADGRAAAAAQLEQALVAQRGVCAQDGVDVDAERVGERAGRRQALALGDAAGEDGLADAALDLQVQRLGGRGVDAKKHLF